MELSSIGGSRRDRRQLLDGSHKGSRHREAGSPRPVVTLTPLRPLRLALGSVYTMSRRGGQDLVRSSNRRALLGKISLIFAVDATQLLKGHC